MIGKPSRPRRCALTRDCQLRCNSASTVSIPSELRSLKQEKLAVTRRRQRFVIVNASGGYLRRPISWLLPNVPRTIHPPLQRRVDVDNPTSADSREWFAVAVHFHRDVAVHRRKIPPASSSYLRNVWPCLSRQTMDPSCWVGWPTRRGSAPSSQTAPQTSVQTIYKTNEWRR